MTTAVDQTREPALSSERGLSRSYARPRRTPLNWVRGGGLAAFLFLLPLLFVFGAFSWYPIVRTAIMAFQHTNFVEAPTWVGFQNFAAVWHDPQFPVAVKNTAYFALLALVFGYPIPLIAAVLMSEVRKRRGLYSVLAFLPVVIPPVVGVLLWKTFYDASSLGVFNTVLHWVGLGPYPWLQSQQWAMPSIVLYSTWANAGTATRRRAGQRSPRRARSAPRRLPSRHRDRAPRASASHRRPLPVRRRCPRTGRRRRRGAPS